MKILLTLWILFSAQLLLANETMLKESQFKYVKQSIGKGKPYFLELGAESCHSCQIMGATLYKVKQEHPEYNIHFINVKKERRVAHELQVMMIPTQIIYDKNGKEVYRHIGILGTNELSKLLEENKF